MNIYSSGSRMFVAYGYVAYKNAMGCCGCVTER